MKKIFSLAAAVLTMLALTVTSFAAPSPSGDKQFVVKQEIVDTGTNKTATGWSKVVKDGETLIITVTEGYENYFVKWNIIGEYEIISGSLDSTTLVIRPLSDVTVQEIVKTDGTTVTPGDKNDSSTSPGTGSAASVLVVLMGASALTAAAAKKRLSK
ncbi:MAG: hypothetical protein ACI4JX_00565 [Oscillospiraceae bacterium]